MAKFNKYDLYIVSALATILLKTGFDRIIAGKKILPYAESALGLNLQSEIESVVMVRPAAREAVLKRLIDQRTINVMEENIDWGWVYYRLAPFENYLINQRGRSEEPDGPIALFHKLPYGFPTEEGTREALWYLDAHALNQSVEEWLPEDEEEVS